LTQRQDGDIVSNRQISTIMYWAEHESKRAGSDWTLIFGNLKTVQGVIKRLQTGKYVHGGRWDIYKGSRGSFVFAPDASVKPVASTFRFNPRDLPKYLENGKW